jgi:hypothetical protein
MASKSFNYRKVDRDRAVLKDVYSQPFHEPEVDALLKESKDSQSSERGKVCR